MQRLFSDPFSFPIEFKSWLVAYLETSDMTLTMTSIQGLQQTLGLSGGAGGTVALLPSGAIVLSAVELPGAVHCDGSGYATTAQPKLFAAIGYSYGGSGGVFNVPNISPVPSVVGPYPSYLIVL